MTHGREEAASDRLAALGKRWPLDPRVRRYVECWRAARPYGAGLFFQTQLDVTRAAWSQDEASGRTFTEADQDVLEDADRLLASLPKRRAALGLLREVYMCPHDLGRRLVLADALLELGDPWGELIALQCARGPGQIASAELAAREQELLAKGSRDWLGRLGSHVADAPAPVFEQGFPAVVATWNVPRVVGIPEWGTVRALVQPASAGASAYLATLGLLTRGHSLRSARVCAVVQGRTSPRLQGTSSSLEHLTLRVTAKGREPGHSLITTLLDEWSRRSTFPNLTRVDLVGDVSFAATEIESSLALLGTPFGARLREIGLSSTVVVVARQLAIAMAAGNPLPVLHTLHDHGSLRFEHATRTLTLTLRGFADLRALGEALVQANLSTLRVEAANEGAWRNVSAREWTTALPSVRLEVVRI